MSLSIQKTTLIQAPPTAIWQVLTQPALMKKWMGEPEMEIEILTTWELGSPILINGFHHFPFENKGIIHQFIPNKILQYSHLSSISNLDDYPENYTIITFELLANDTQTELTITLQQFPTESIFKHLELYWNSTIYMIKEVAERTEKN